MGQRPGTFDQPVMRVGPTGTRLVQPDQFFHLIKNFRPTEQGGLVSINGPLPYIAKPVDGGPPNDFNTSSVNPNTPVYGKVRGVFHATLRNGDREVILLHVDNEIWEFRGWARRWRCIIGGKDASQAPEFVTSELEEPLGSDWPIQWAATPTGIVIVPPNSRAFFYDGETALPLGYDAPPSPPTGLGPTSTSSEWFPDNKEKRSGVNDGGYAMDGLIRRWNSSVQESHPPSASWPWLRYGRLGTVDTPGNVTALAQNGNEGLGSQVMGYLMPGRYRACVQFVDRWGNLSPLSRPSNDIKFQRQPSMVPVVADAGPPVTYKMQWVFPDCVRKQVAWTGIRPGPEGTIGRILYRTKDLENSGDARFWEVPRDAAVTVGAFATLPDNMSTTYCDNIPDAWLVNLPIDVIAVPKFRLCATAFSRLWMANADGDEGALWWSMPGRYGTIERSAKLYPAPDGAPITGLHPVPGGLLVFSRTGTFLVEENGQGSGFRSRLISSRVGCIAPSSIVTMRNGIVVWLGEDGFYAWNGSEPTYLWGDYRLWAKRFNRGKMQRATACFDSRHGEYRCWVAYDGSERNNLCFVYDGTYWSQRDDVYATGVVVTADHRQWCLAAGYEPVSGKHGLWVLDAAGAQVDGTLKTGWMRSERSKEESSVRSVYLWLRETGEVESADKLQVKVRINYMAEVVDTKPIQLMRDVARGYGNTKALWGETALGASGAKFRIRRPFWAVANVDIPSCESFQLELTCTERFEILAIAFEEQPRVSAGAQKTR